LLALAKSGQRLVWRYYIATAPEPLVLAPFS